MQYNEYIRPENHAKTIKPDEIYFRLTKISEGFKFGRQEDASEFFLKLIESIATAFSENERKTADPLEEIERPLDLIFMVVHNILAKCNDCQNERILQENDQLISLR